MQIVSVAGVRLRVVDRGRGAPLLLVHGFPLDHSMWTAQSEHFSQRYRVIAPDLRGFGGSDVGEGTASMEIMADDLAGLLDALGVDSPVVLCGLSMGGYVAFQFWRKHAARLRALVLCDTRSTADTPEAASARLTLVEHVLRAGTQYLADAMLSRLFAAKTFEDRPQVVECERKNILAASAQGAAAALRGLAARPDVNGLLPRIALPTLVLVGEQDAISTVEEMRAMARAIPAAEFVVIPNSGHMTPLENPAAFNAALDAFLARVASE